jgi:hypothetical protein
MLANVQPETPIAVKVVVVDGRPHFCTVYPPAEPRPSLSWGQQVRNHHDNTPTGERSSAFVDYILTKDDQEN